MAETEGLRGKTYEIIFIDDGSTDKSPEVLKKVQSGDTRVRIFRFGQNRGKASGLSLGFDKADGDFVITMDADLQDNPKEISDLIALLDEGFDLISGWKKHRHDPIEKRLPSKFFNLVTSWACGIRLHDFNCGLKAYRNKVVKSLYFYGDMHRYLPALAFWGGFKVGEKVVEHRARQFGKSKYGIMRYFHGLFDIITISFIKKYMKRPLHFFGLIGSISFLIGAIPLVYFGIQWIQTRELHIRPLLLIGVLFIIMGVQFFSIGLIGEMIAYFGPKHDIDGAEEISSEG